VAAASCGGSSVPGVTAATDDGALRVISSSGGAGGVDVAASELGVYIVGNQQATLAGVTPPAPGPGAFFGQATGNSPWLKSIVGHRAAALALAPTHLIVATTVSLGGRGPHSVVAAHEPKSGAPLWAIKLVASAFATAKDVTTDGQDVYVVGEFSGQLSLGKHTVTADGLTDGFVAALASDGTPRWLLRFGGAGPSSATAVALRDGGIAVVGSFLGPAEVGKTTLESDDDSFDIAVMAIDREGTVQWAASVGGAGTDLAADVVTRTGAVVVLGSFEGGLMFAGAPLRASGSSDMLLAVYSGSGKEERAIAIGGAGTDVAAKAIRYDDLVMVSGTFATDDPGSARSVLANVGTSAQVRSLAAGIDLTSIAANGSRVALTGTARGSTKILDKPVKAPEAGAAFATSASIE